MYFATILCTQYPFYICNINTSQNTTLSYHHYLWPGQSLMAYVWANPLSHCDSDFSAVK